MRSVAAVFGFCALLVMAAFIIGWTGKTYFPSLHEQIELVEIEAGFDDLPYYVGTLDFDKKLN